MSMLTFVGLYIVYYVYVVLMIYDSYCNTMIVGHILLFDIIYYIYLIVNNHMSCVCGLECMYNLFTGII